MTRDEALALRTFDHCCNCGGYAWNRNGRDPKVPHMTWCPQAKQYAEWVAALPPDYFTKDTP